MVDQELLVLLARWVLLDLKVFPVCLVVQDSKEPLDRQDHKGLLEVKVQRALLDLQEFLDLKAFLDLLVHLAHLVLQDFLVSLELLDRTERLVHLAFRAPLV